MYLVKDFIYLFIIFFLFQHSMSERIAGSPSKRVSKIFSFRTKDQTGKRRRRKDDADENEDDSKYLNWKYYHIMNTII